MGSKRRKKIKKTTQIWQDLFQDVRGERVLTHTITTLLRPNRVTHDLQVRQQPHDVGHVGEDEQAGDGGEQSAGRPHHGASLDRGARVVGKLGRGDTHRLPCRSRTRKSNIKTLYVL